MREIIEDDIVQVKVEATILVNHEESESISCVPCSVATIQQPMIIKESFCGTKYNTKMLL